MCSSAILQFSVDYRFNIASDRFSDRSSDRSMGFSYTPKCWSFRMCASSWCSFAINVEWLLNNKKNSEHRFNRLRFSRKSQQIEDPSTLKTVIFNLKTNHVQRCSRYCLLSFLSLPLLVICLMSVSFIKIMSSDHHRFEQQFSSVQSPDAVKCQKETERVNWNGEYCLFGKSLGN